ncbi:uncharacterized protein LOC120130003 [Hibiscus syriacus]|uniref:uncharacterized protein LOC120130003 n=1 Tax=Hibiscus syriacus TaxID=106335 RepID=UPI0019247F0E|nr:uncharacterized protein LOC120130003 [Hibiscus syriacus]
MAKGLRQGCSLSPPLFNIVGEILYLMLSKAVEKGLFQGFVIGKAENSTRLSHLQFADDLIIFCQANLTQIKNVIRMLRIFSVMAGLHLNLVKSKLFGINIEDEVLADWASQVGCSVGYFPTEYLGLPLGAKRNSEALWDPFFRNFSAKLAGWKASYLSLACRTGKVVEFGSFEPSGWVWNVQTRRNLYDWELVQWMDLMSKLKDIQLSELVEDFLSWSASRDGLYSVKSCRNTLASEFGGSVLWIQGVWMGLAPPRVEAFLWQLAHQKVAVKVELVKRGIPLRDDILCPLCKKQEESVQHLFISCNVVWELWNKIASFWDISLVLPHDPPSLLSSLGNLEIYSGSHLLVNLES